MNANSFAFRKELVFPSLQKDACAFWMICHEVKAEEIENLLGKKEK